MKEFTFSAQVANNLLTVLQGYSKTIRLLLVMFLALTVTTNAWGADVSVTWPKTTALSTTATIVDGDANVTIKVSEANAYTSPLRFYAGRTTTIEVAEGYQLKSVAYEASSTGNYVTYAQNATVSPDVDPTVNGKIITWDLSKSNTQTFTFQPSSQTRCNGITITYTYTAGGGGSTPTLTVDKTSLAFGNVATDSNKELDFTLTGSNLTANASLQLSGINPGMFSLSSNSVTQSAGSINQTITVTYTPTATGSHNATLTISSTGAESKTVTLSGTGVAPAAKYTVTFNAGSGTCDDESLTETSGGAGVTLPTANPSATCQSEGWTFAGWAEASVATETEEAPTTLYEAGDIYKPTSNITLYAVYQRTEGGGGGGEASLTKMVAGNTLSDGDKIVVVANETSTAMYQETINSSYVNKWDCSTLTADVVADDDKNWWTVTMTTGGFYLGDATNGYLNMSSNNLYCNANTSVWTLLDLEDGTFKLQSNGRNLSYRSDLNTNPYWRMGGASYGTSGQTILNLYKYTSGGGGSTTYYHSTPDCASTPTLTVDKTSLAFGNVATDSNKELDFTLTGSNLTANASLQLSGINPGMFSLSSNSVTQSAGSINQTITVTYTPTATGSHNATLTISSTGAESKTVTLSGTGVAPAAKYTVTFNAGSGTCDDESLTETSGGAGVTLPTANPPAACATDGWEFAGWWTESVAGTTTSPGELLTAGSNYKPASDCTLYAVYSHTEAGGGGSGFYLSVTKDATTYYIGEKGSGSYLSAVTDVNSAATFNIESNQYLYYGNKTYVSSISDNTSLTIATTTPSATWTITDEGETITFKSNGTGGRYLAFNYNSGSPRFSSYGSTYTYELTKHTTSTTTYNSNPVCVASWSITYNFAGGTGSHCSNTSVPQGDPYTICDEAPTKEGYTFQGWSDGTSTYAAGATITPTKNTTLTAQWQIKTYTVTWSNNGVTTPVTYEHGDDLTLPSAPVSCDGVKEFVGWTEQSGYYHATDAPTDLFKTTTATVTADKTYYAVFATPPGTGGGGGGSETTIDDVLTRETTGVTSGSTNYASWSGKTATSSAIYAGNSAGGNDAIQLRSNNSNSGIVTTTSGGKITHVEVDWESNTASDRTLDIYGRNVAYSDATDLYSTSTQGTKLGSIVYGTSTELEITGDYEYIGLRSKSGAMYLTSVTITWSSAGGSSSHTDYTTICQEVTGIAISGSYPTTFVQYDSFSFAGGIVTATFENGSTQDVTSLATFSGYNMDEVGVQTVTVTYMGQTAKYEITINQSDRWRLTWNVSGKTNTGASPIYVQKGSAIGTLPVPGVPAACAGKTFMGWTESNIVPSDGKGIVYITEETVPSKNTTYYAVFATINNFSTQAAIEDIESGSKVVIVAVASMDASGGAGQAISSRTISITSQGVIGLSGDEVSIFDETINTPHSTCIWTLTKEGGGIVFEQEGKYIRAVNNGYRRLLLETTKDYWTLSPVGGKDKTYHMQSGNTSHYVEWFDHTDSKYAEGERYIGFVPYTEANDNGDFDMQFYVTANADGNADITDYTTGCAEYTITYYGFHGGYSTSCSSDGTIVLPVNSLHTVPNCGNVVNDHTNLGREFLNVWMTQPHGGHTFKPGDTFILTQDTTLYAQWKMETTSDVTTLPTDVEDLAGTDIYVYGGTTLNIQPGTTTINSLTLKGGLQADGSYKMPTVWVPEGATLVRNSNKINLDLKVNAKNYYPFAVPFAAKNNENVEYLDPVLAGASTYGTHFAIKTYEGARRADVGEDKANNWVRVLRGETLQPGVGYIITALTYPTADTATIRIPMTVPNTWFQNGEQAAVSTTVRNTIAVTAHAGAAATEHKRHAGWNFVANPYLTSFTGGNVANDGGLDYINGELIIQGSYEYTDEEVPYVTVPAYDFAYYSQHKLSEVKLSPEWSFFVQVGTGGTMNFTTAGRQQAPASIAARNAEERPVKMDVDLILSDNHSSDQTGIIISDRYTDAYEIGRDLEKLFGSAYNLSVYTLMEDNTPLAFQALAIRSSMQVIPVGYRAPEQGEYTFRLNEATSSIDLLNEQYEQLVLVDYQTGELTNLLYTDYTFYSERTQSNSRFAIYAVPRQNAPTDLPNAIGSDEEVRKVIYNDHLYILRDGNVYNGMGQKM